MFYFQKMKSVLKCLSLSLISFSPSHPSPSLLSTLPSQAGGYQLPCWEKTTVINFAVHFKRQTLSFLAVFLTLLVGATRLLLAPYGQVGYLAWCPRRTAVLGPSKLPLPTGVSPRVLPAFGRTGTLQLQDGGIAAVA